MKNDFNYVSIDRVLSKFNRDIGMEGISESDAIEWIGEALEGIGVVGQYEEAVAIIEVKNHQAILPHNFHKIIQIARNNCFTKGVEGLCAKTVLSTLPAVNPLVDSPHIPVVLDQLGQPLQEYDLAYYRPYFDLRYEYSGWMGTGIYRGCFTPVKKATSSFSSLVCEELDTDLKGLYSSCSDEYTIIQKQALRFNFCDGQIALAYLRQPMDEETGYPMVPDNYSYLKAITAYVTMMVFNRHYYAGRDGAKGKADKAEADWQWYCQQAGNISKIPNGIDEHENLMKGLNYLVPRTNEYNNFFGRLGYGENRRFNNPDYRNRKY